MTIKEKGILAFHYWDINFRVKKSGLRKIFLSNVMMQEKANFTRIDYIFCPDHLLIGLNRKFLNHDTYTDILTFNIAGPKDPIIAEIYISIERVRENAKAMKLPFKEELNRVMIHGLMHLCGYNDGTEAEIKKMRAKENYYLSQIDF